MSDGKVKTICYGRERIWDSREEAKRFFAQGAMSCDGAEVIVYLKILTRLHMGLDVCSDL